MVKAVKLRDTEEDRRELSSALREERERMEKISKLFSGLEPLLTTLDVDTLLWWTIKTVRELTGAPYAHVVTFGGRHRTQASEELGTFCPTWLHPEISRLVLESARETKIVQKDADIIGIEHLTAVPLICGDGMSSGTAVGTLVVGKWLSANEEALLELLAGKVAAVLEENSGWAPGGRDPPTSLANSASLARVLQREMGGKLAVLLVGAHGLDAYSDIRGMDAVDRLLRGVGDELEAHGFKAFRYTHDVLAIILKGYDDARTRKAALQIRGFVTRATRNCPVRIEAPVGYCLLDRDSEDAESSLELALEALRRAKAAPERIAGVGPDVSKFQEGSETTDHLTEPSRVSEALVVAMESKSPYTGSHMRAVAEIAMHISSEMELAYDVEEVLFFGALLHDVGKLGTPDAILNKRGQLRPEEYELLKLHPLVGTSILEPLGGTLAASVPAVKHHHERYDGFGYPDGLSGEEIPLMARVVLVADAFDSMVRDRPYRRGISTQSACEEITTNAGSQFDPAVVKAFLRTMERPYDVTGNSSR